MKIKVASIIAFRNVECVTFTAKKLNLITGNNMRGKTNTLNAIMWCLTGVDLNGSNDNSLNIPKGKKEAKVRLELYSGVIERIAVLNDNNEVNTTVIINGEKLGSKTAESKIDELLGISEIARFDTQKVKVKRLLLNPLYYRSVAPKDLRNWLISVLFGSIKESQIIKQSNLTEKVKNILLNELKDLSLAELSSVCNKNIKDLKNSLNEKKLIKDFLISKNIVAYNNEITEEEKSLKTSLLKYSELQVAVEEAALELSKFYSNVLSKRTLDIVLLEKNKDEDSWSEVCYPRIISNMPIQNGSTAEIIVVSVMFVNLIETLTNTKSMTKLIDEGETLDKQMLEMLSESNSQLLITRVLYERQEGVEIK